MIYEDIIEKKVKYHKKVITKVDKNLNKFTFKLNNRIFTDDQVNILNSDHSYITKTRLFTPYDSFLYLS